MRCCLTKKNLVNVLLCCYATLNVYKCHNISYNKYKPVSQMFHNITCSYKWINSTISVTININITSELDLRSFSLAVL